MFTETVCPLVRLHEPQSMGLTLHITLANLALSRTEDEAPVSTFTFLIHRNSIVVTPRLTGEG